MVIKLDNAYEGTNDLVLARTQFTKAKEELIHVIDHVAYLSNQHVLSIHRGTFIISFIKVKDTALTHGSSLYLKPFVQELIQALTQTNTKLNPRIGIGKISPEFLELRKSYVQAQEAIRIASHVKANDVIAFYEELLIYHLLDSVNNRETLDELYTSALGRLIEYDKTNKTSLVETLEQYFQSGGNISDAAKNMYLHRNTFIYRFEKIKSILQSELKNPEEVFKIQMGLLIMKVLKTGIPGDKTLG
jgi:purine catabolism regulator